ncbi:MAG: terminase [Deltaproteobacteria bacterium]|nr:terminase [Deltaproteobacteria bacterium]
MQNVDAAKQQLRMHFSKTEFYYFVKYCFQKQFKNQWQHSSHHEAICADLMRVYNGGCPRLIINMPPRYSKTSLAVIYFVAWCLGHCPDSEFIHTSYSASLAASNSWKARELVQSEHYQEIFKNTRLRQDSMARAEWRTTDGGCMYAVGSGGTITGYGAGKVRPGFGGCIIVDDPHKADEASSPVMRQNVIDWFQNTLESRCNSPHTPIIVIMQRLHENDLTGWLLKGGNGEKWEHLCLQAMPDEHTALWPEKHSLETLKRMRDASPLVFAGQYQQSPHAREGNFFKPDNIKVVDAIPEGLNWCRAWDLAASTDGDWTAGVKIAKYGQRFLVGDIVRLRGTPDEVRTAVKNTASRDGILCKVRLPQDPGQAGKEQAQSYTRMLAGYSVRSQPVTGGKESRAEPFASQVNVGNVDIVRGEWNNAFIDELRVFPNGTFDDQVDASADAFTEIQGNALALWENCG